MADGLEVRKDEETPLARRIRQERQARGWTLAQLSERCGVSAASLSKVENGRMALGYENLRKLAGGLGIPVDDLFRNPVRTPHSERRSHNRAEDARVLNIPGYELRYFAPEVLDKRLVPMLTVVTARTVEEAGGLKFHGGEEVYYVVAGTALLHTETYAPLKVKAGECVFMDGEMGHAFTTAGRTEATIFSVNEGKPVYSLATGALCLEGEDRAAAPSPARGRRPRKTP